MTANDRARPCLLVLVSSDCGDCRRAVGIAADFGEASPHVQVRVVNISHEPVPDGVILVGTPMYIDDTFAPTVISLGNPTPAELARHYGHAR